MSSQFLLFICLSARLTTVIGFHGNSMRVFPARSCGKFNHQSISMSFVDDLVSVKSKVLSKFGGPIGFYALMLAPIYGIGLPFFGSMTDFETLQNRGSPGVIANEYIVAPSSFTPARTNYPPYFDVSAADLEKAFDTVALRQPRITAIATDESTHRREYVQRALIFRWPDVITFQPIPLGDSKSTLAVHSYSIYGAGDLGVNEARVKSWIAEVETELAKK
jgi:uncharacterized protein (DUF1499 family)